MEIYKHLSKSTIKVLVDQTDLWTYQIFKVITVPEPREKEDANEIAIVWKWVDLRNSSNYILKNMNRDEKPRIFIYYDIKTLLNSNRLGKKDISLIVIYQNKIANLIRHFFVFAVSEIFSMNIENMKHLVHLFRSHDTKAI